MLEDQLVDGRAWLLDTTGPGLVDLSIYAFVSWFKTVKLIREQVFATSLYPKIEAVRSFFPSSVLLPHLVLVLIKVVGAIHESHRPDTKRGKERTF